MIQSKQDLKRYLELDRRALEYPPVSGSMGLLRALLFPNYIARFQRYLRYVEYLHNVRKDPVAKVIRLYRYQKYSRLGRALGFSIPINVFGPGLSIAHQGTLVVNKGARIGANCRIHTCVNIGTAPGQSHEAPIIGDNVYIGPGAKIYGPIRIADGCAIGANAVGNKSFLVAGSLIAGVPARVVGTVDTRKMIPILLADALARAAKEGN